MHNHVLSIHTYVFLDKFTSMADLKYVACECVEENADKLNKLSQDIWNNPELAFEEFHAHETLTKFLEENGFEVQRKCKLETAFCAVYGEGKPHVAVLCEYDALLDIDHGFGHKLIAEVGVTTGLSIKAAMDAAGKGS